MSNTIEEPVEGDAWGQALLDYLHGERDEILWLDIDDGRETLAMQPEWFFREEARWEPQERELFSLVTRGPVLDLGAGAGRSALHLQQRGFDVTAVELSVGAAEVCRLRGVRDVREQNLLDPPTDAQWGTVLLLCGNLGLGGDWDGNRRLLRRLAEICTPDALLIGDSVNHDGNGEIGLRLRYRSQITPWWRQCNVAAGEVPALIAGTGWGLERHLHADNGLDHYIALRRL